MRRIERFGWAKTVRRVALPVVSGAIPQTPIRNLPRRCDQIYGDAQGMRSLT